jgi:hypothetical protein
VVQEFLFKSGRKEISLKSQSGERVIGFCQGRGLSNQENVFTSRFKINAMHKRLAPYKDDIVELLEGTSHPKRQELDLIVYHFSLFGLAVSP